MECKVPKPPALRPLPPGIDLTRMECKVSIWDIRIFNTNRIDLTRMECKGTWSLLLPHDFFGIDLTRMECKA